MTRYFLVINVFHRGPYGPPLRSNWTLGPIASRGWSVLGFLRNHIANCVLLGGGGSGPPVRPSVSTHVE